MACSLPVMVDKYAARLMAPQKQIFHREGREDREEKIK